MLGGWDEALALTDVAADSPPPIPRALLEPLRLQIRLARGEDVAAEARSLRKFWAREGGVAINASAVEMDAAGHRGDAAGAVEAYDEVVAVLSRIWHEWFSARIRLGAITIARDRRAVPTMSAAERAQYAERVDRIHADGHVVLDRYSDPSGHWGPEGRAWMKRLDAETLRFRWLAGVDAPPLDALVGVWRETIVVFEDFGHVHELARVRTALAGILRATGDLAGARELGDPAREAAHALGAVRLLEDLRAIGSTPARTRVRARRAHPARDRDPGAGRRGSLQRRDRQAAVHQRQDGLGARLQHPRQARRLRPHRGRRDRAPPGTDRLTGG